MKKQLIKAMNMLVSYETILTDNYVDKVKTIYTIQETKNSLLKDLSKKVAKYNIAESIILASIVTYISAPSLLAPMLGLLAYISNVVRRFNSFYNYLEEYKRDIN